MATSRLITTGLGVLLLATLTGCPNGALYRTARTLEPGEADVSYTFSATRIAQSDYETTDENGDKVTEKGDSVVLPNLIPEISAHVGVVDNLEIGGRLGLGSMIMELDAKYRFVGDKDARMHVAIQPAVGYRTFVFVEGVHATLPLIMTYDITPFLSVNFAPFVSYTNYEAVDDDLDVDFAVTALQAGGGVGLQFRGETFHLMPGVEVSRTFAQAEAEGSQADADFTFVNFGVTFGFIYGRELKEIKRTQEKLDDMDKKLDRINDKLDKAAPEG